MARVSQLSIYPVKALGGIDLKETALEKRGLKNDRRFMLTDPSGKFITQRNFPSLSLITTEIDDETISFNVGDEKHSLNHCELSEQNGDFEVTVWNSEVQAIDCGEAVAAVFSEYLENECRLVYMPESTSRLINPLFNKGEETVSFADGYPILVTTSASLGWLNSRMSLDLPMTRFRPNIVLEDTEPFEEDKWKRLKIGENVLRVTKPCARCVVTTVDQKRGLSESPEPLKTLNRFRRSQDVYPDSFESFGLGKNDVLFGTNLVAEEGFGRISVGDQVEVI